MPRTFYECGCCGAYHPEEFEGDCREDAERYYFEHIGDDDIIVSLEEQEE